MKYYSEKELKEEVLTDEEFKYIKDNCTPINVHFCRDCKFFECDGIQPDQNIVHGRCLHLSEEPPFIRVNSTDFCSKSEVI